MPPRDSCLQRSCYILLWGLAATFLRAQFNEHFEETLLGTRRFAGSLALGTIASARGEHLNAVWLVVAAACIFMLGYRFYSRFLAFRVVQLDDRRATPAERLEDGRDFVVTNKWVVFGQHFAAIAGPGPLVGPILAAQFGYLPGTLWIVIGGVLGGAVQDFVTLFCSVRRDGKSLGQMAKEEISSAAGFTSLFAVLCILVILLAAVALVVVNALKSSPWGLFTVSMTIPIAVLMGIYFRYLRPGPDHGDLHHRLSAGVRVRAGGALHRGFAHRRAAVYLCRPGSRSHGDLLWLRRFGPSRVAAAGPSRLHQHLRQARSHLPSGRQEFSLRIRKCSCRPSRALWMGPAPFSPERSSPSASSPSLAAQFPDSIR